MDILTENIDEDCVGAVGGVCSKELNEETINKDLKCQPCLFDNLEVKATAFCVDCYEHICFNCARDHRKNKILRNHKILEGEGVPDQLKAIKDLKKMMVCPDHPEIDFTFKCEDHDVYICVKCLAQSHRICNNVNEIQNLSTFGNADTCGAVKESLTQLQEYTDTSIKETEENKETLRTTLLAVKKEQQNVFDKIYEQLSNTKEKLDMKTSSLFMKELNGLEKNLQKNKDAREEETQYQRLLEVTERFGNATELTVIPDVISQKAKYLKENIKSKHQKEGTCLIFDSCMDFDALTNVGKVFVLSSEQANHSEICDKYSLTSDEILEPVKAASDTFKLPANKNSHQFSEIKLLDTNAEQLEHESFLTEQSKGSTPDVEQKQNHPSLMNRTINHHGTDYTMRCSGDTFPCNKQSIVILPNEQVVCIDCDNMKLKVFRENFSLSFAHRFQDKPQDMCHVEDMTIAVVFSDVNHVEKYCVGQSHASCEGKFAVSSKFQIKALAKFGDDREIAILLSEDNNNTAGNDLFVQIRDADKGYILHTFDFEKHCGGKFNFGDDGVNRLICRETNEILVSDFWKLYCFDIEDDDCENVQESWFYKMRKGPFLKNITDLAVDEEGNIYVCGFDSNNVHQIAAHDYRENRILVTNIEEPLSISVNSKKGYFIVACEEDDYLHVFKFSYDC